MCGRYSFALDRDQTVALTGSAPVPFPTPVYNRSPGTEVSVLDREGAWNARVWGVELRVQEGRKKWVINARTETAAEKSVFRTGFRSRRCVLPASGFFEWRRREVGSQPFYFHALEGEGILLGAVELERAEERSVVILTGQADPWMAEVHHRAPVLVRPERLPGWLEPIRSGEEALSECCFPGQEAVLRRHPVSSRVNRVKENDPGLLVPVAEETLPEQTDLFGN